MLTTVIAKYLSWVLGNSIIYKMFTKVVREQHFSLKRGEKGDMYFNREWECVMKEVFLCLLTSGKKKTLFF